MLPAVQPVMSTDGVSIETARNRILAVRIHEWSGSGCWAMKPSLVFTREAIRPKGGWAREVTRTNRMRSEELTSPSAVSFPRPDNNQSGLFITPSREK